MCIVHPQRRPRRLHHSSELWSVCGPLIQFLDPRSGQMRTQTNLFDGKHDWDISESVLARDGTTLYVVFPTRRQIVVSDLVTREIL
jgi:hypothetical protein